MGTSAMAGAFGSLNQTLQSNMLPFLDRYMSEQEKKAEKKRQQGDIKSFDNILDEMNMTKGEGEAVMDYENDPKKKAAATQLVQSGEQGKTNFIQQAQDNHGFTKKQAESEYDKQMKQAANFIDADLKQSPQTTEQQWEDPNALMPNWNQPSQPTDTQAQGMLSPSTGQPPVGMTAQAGGGNQLGSSMRSIELRGKNYTPSEKKLIGDSERNADRILNPAPFEPKEMKRERRALLKLYKLRNKMAVQGASSQEMSAINDYASTLGNKIANSLIDPNTQKMEKASMKILEWSFDRDTKLKLEGKKQSGQDRRQRRKTASGKVKDLLDNFKAQSTIVNNTETNMTNELTKKKDLRAKARKSSKTMEKYAEQYPEDVDTITEPGFFGDSEKYVIKKDVDRAEEEKLHTLRRYKAVLKKGMTRAIDADDEEIDEIQKELVNADWILSNDERVAKALKAVGATPNPSYIEDQVGAK